MKCFPKNIILFVLLVIPVSVKSQSFLNRFSFDYGRIRNLQNAFEKEDDKYSYCTEFKIGGNLNYKFLEWELYYGFWDDGVKDYESIRGTDNPSYKLSGKIIGLRLNFLPVESTEDWIFPVHLTVGLSNHFNHMDYLGGTDFSGNRGKDMLVKQYMVEVGGGLNYGFFRLFRLRADILYLFDLYNSHHNEAYGEDYTFKLGLDLYFKEL